MFYYSDNTSDLPSDKPISDSSRLFCNRSLIYIQESIYFCPKLFKGKLNLKPYFISMILAPKASKGPKANDGENIVIYPNCTKV